MPAYRYRQGDRPLDGYTIEHGVGRGGFGEVYYAVSDSGRQVAIKSIHQYEDIELRGIGHVMNLKSPHLVSIFDVKRSERGEPFVIMEYVSGPSMRDVLDEYPDGMGNDKAAFFVREIAKGLTLLHDSGIVHRDLKPHNIFYEDGYVKIGDYSLSKVITASHRSGHTMTVGTVHYMAPEIGMGKYDKTVDIYALGIILYEMIKGVPPFQGESMGEVLMKHLSQELDLEGIEEPYASVIGKALAKNPEERYQSPEEMVEALFGADHVRESVTVFNPQSLTIMAERAKIPLPASRDDAQPIDSKQRTDRRDERPRQQREADSISRRESNPKLARSLGRLGGRIGASLGVLPFSFANKERQQKDPLSFIHRLVLTGLCVYVISVFVSGFARQSFGHHDPTDRAVMMGGIVCVWGVISRLLIIPLLSMNTLLHRIIFVGSYVVMVIIFSESGFRDTARYLMPVSFGIGLLDFRWLVSPVRPKRLRLTPCLFAGFATMFAGLAVMPDQFVPAAMGFALGLTMAVQLLSPFDPKASAEIERSVSWFSALGDSVSTWYEWRFPEKNMAHRTGRAIGNVVRPISEAAQSFGQVISEQVVAHKERWHEGRGKAKATEEKLAREKVAIVRSADVLIDDSNDIGLEAFRADDSVHGGPEQDPLPSRESSWSGSSVRDDSTYADDPQFPSRAGSFLLAMIPFASLGMIPICGLHRFYTGRRISGLVWLLTFGLLGVGQLVDLVMIVLGEFVDGEGRNLLTRQKNDQQSEQVNGLSSVPFAKPTTSRRMVVISGGMLIASLMLGLSMATDFPRMIDGDIFADAGLSKADAEFAFGDVQNWQHVMFDLGLLFTCMVGISTVLLLVVSRAKYGVLHMFRVIVACGAFVGSFFAFHEGVHRMDWKQISWGMETGRIGLMLDEVFGRNDFIGMTIVTALIIMVGMIILAIPPRRARTRVIERVTTLVEQEA
jgi:serine/threonine protein kinase/TM2 domain-containing membrane protein YozV